VGESRTYITDLTGKLLSLYGKLPVILKDKSNSFLEEEIEIVPGRKETRMNGILFFDEHIFYYCAQTATIIRAIRREGPFG
jgi:hypothetical protein